jgi:hypothetical protein
LLKQPDKHEIATPATVAAIITAAGVAAITAAGERITAGGSVQELSSLGTRLESIMLFPLWVLLVSIYILIDNLRRPPQLAAISPGK